MSSEYPCIYFEKDGKCRKFSDDTVISYCVMGPCSEQKLSNADRIRSMSDEELAWELMVWRCEAVSRHHGVESKYPDTQQTILKWLQQSTEEDT